ncbi:MAG TPA: metalloregulator ArsR/SmtB family transcription factor [Ktedonobacteraceae bacterium]|nr:metalloregulator ArsR/SmtB family transcription factor [Ktedonobacteraceae bacterium]
MSHLTGKSEEASSYPLPIEPEKVAELQTLAPSDKLIALVAGTFQALGDPTRLKMLYALSRHSCCVRDLAILAGVSESAVSHQLRLLKDRRLVKQRREGTTIYYSLNDTHLAMLFREAEYHADHVYQDFPDHPALEEATRGRYR